MTFLATLRGIFRRHKKLTPLTAPTPKREPTINITCGPTKARKSPRLHIVTAGDKPMCGQPGTTPDDTIRGSEFEAWVTAEPRGRHGFRKGLCCNCRAHVPSLLEALEEVLKERGVDGN